MLLDVLLRGNLPFFSDICISRRSRETIVYHLKEYTDGIYRWVKYGKTWILRLLAWLVARKIRCSCVIIYILCNTFLRNWTKALGFFEKCMLRYIVTIIVILYCSYNLHDYLSNEQSQNLFFFILSRIMYHFLRHIL